MVWLGKPGQDETMVLSPSHRLIAWSDCVSMRVEEVNKSMEGREGERERWKRWEVGVICLDACLPNQRCQMWLLSRRSFPKPSLSITNTNTNFHGSMDLVPFNLGKVICVAPGQTYHIYETSKSYLIFESYRMASKASKRSKKYK